MQDDIEQEIQAKGCDVYPRITKEDIEANISSEHYFTAAHGYAGRYMEDRYLRDYQVGDSVPVITLNVPFPLTLLTFCVLVLKNGFTVTGESACASPENFNAEIGRKIARQKAVEKIWPLLGYELKTRLAGMAGDFTAVDMATAAADGYRDGVRNAAENS